ncbi:phosphoadenosine phosphosulfate reductase [Salmonella enterica]|nr:phosphoadenosine phosphosulfate reductase [Salmonella enterica]GAR02621.1 phosphoadenosine phosphosulfate reductase [Salmonella enterica]GAR24504.1 phosphoadenosine phosphosulfate reductase [Salmonella enterica]GAR65415.1 phosphoadenosine phosphosulfate reductase [Salmonella enterica]GAR75896.1 phosphoadenosine phosphosulfate reductase [Salmonella enterica]
MPHFYVLEDSISGRDLNKSGSRATLPVLAIQRGVFKVLPIID